MIPATLRSFTTTPSLLIHAPQKPPPDPGPGAGLSRAGCTRTGGLAGFQPCCPPPCARSPHLPASVSSLRLSESGRRPGSGRLDPHGAHDAGVPGRLFWSRRPSRRVPGRFYGVSVSSTPAARVVRRRNARRRVCGTTRARRAPCPQAAHAASRGHGRASAARVRRQVRTHARRGTPPAGPQGLRHASALRRAARRRRRLA